MAKNVPQAVSDDEWTWNILYAKLLSDQADHEPRLSEAMRIRDESSTLGVSVRELERLAAWFDGYADRWHARIDIIQRDNSLRASGIWWLQDGEPDEIRRSEKLLADFKGTPPKVSERAERYRCAQVEWLERLPPSTSEPEPTRQVPRTARAIAIVCRQQAAAIRMARPKGGAPNDLGMEHIAKFALDHGIPASKVVSRLKAESWSVSRDAVQAAMQKIKSHRSGRGGV